MSTIKDLKRCYAGENVEFCREFPSWNKANKYYQKIRKEFLEKHDDEPERIYDGTWGGCGKWVHPEVCYHSKYIGDGERVQMTKKKPIGKGWHPYC